MTNTIIAVYNSHEEAEAAVKSLANDGVDLKKLSIVGKNYHSEENVTGYYTNGDRMKTWGSAGAFWGGLWGLLFGAGVFFIPGFGPVAIAGPLIASVVAGLEGAITVGGISALGAALIGLGIPKHSVLKYETEIKSDKLVIIYKDDNGKDIETIKAKLEENKQANVDAF